MDTLRGWAKTIIPTPVRRALRGFAFGSVLAFKIRGYCPLVLPWFPSARGQDATAKLHRRAAWLEWRWRWEPRISLIISTLAWPLTALVQSIWYALLFRKAELEGAPRSWMIRLLESWWLAVRYGIVPVNYYRFKPFLRGEWDLVPYFFQHAQHELLLRHLARGFDTRALFDKALFHRTCSAHGLPSIPVLFSGRKGRIDPDEEQVLRTLPPEDLFLKPSGRWGGLGCEVWEFENGGPHWKRGGLHLSGKELVKRVRDLSRQGWEYVVQPMVRNQPQLEGLGQGALVTVRLVTISFPGETPFAISARLAFPVTPTETDHDGMGAVIDLETGELGPGVTLFFDASVLKALPPTRTLAYWESHPVTGEPIEGVVLDGWKETVDLCLRAHEAFGPMPSIGWDVALTPDGPALVEGNTGWGYNSSELYQEKPLGLTGYPECHLAWLNRLA
jgi:hypothetical protein